MNTITIITSKDWTLVRLPDPKLTELLFSVVLFAFATSLVSADIVIDDGNNIESQHQCSIY